MSSDDSPAGCLGCIAVIVAVFVACLGIKLIGAIIPYMVPIALVTGVASTIATLMIGEAKEHGTGYLIAGVIMAATGLVLIFFTQYEVFDQAGFWLYLKTESLGHDLVTLFAPAAGIEVRGAVGSVLAGAAIGIAGGMFWGCHQMNRTTVGVLAGLLIGAAGLALLQIGPNLDQFTPCSTGLASSSASSGSGQDANGTQTPDCTDVDDELHATIEYIDYTGVTKNVRALANQNGCNLYPDSASNFGYKLDLNEDGQPEFALCCILNAEGACQMKIISRVGDELTVIFDHLCTDFVVLDTSASGFHDLCIDGVPMRYTGGRYSEATDSSGADKMGVSAGTGGADGSASSSRDSVPVAPPAAAPAVEAVSPSFDCGAASTRVEHAICDDPDLARLDVTMADAYQAARGRLSQNDKRRLRDEQRSWLQQREQCSSRTDMTGCLRRELTERTSVLQRW